MEILNIENLTFKYPASESNAVDGVSFSVSEGDFTLLCGGSGSGKTTLLKLLKEEIAPYGEKSGSVTFAPNVKVGIVMQDVENQIVSDTVWHNLAFALENQNKSSSEIRQKIAEITEYFDISHLFYKNTFNLSGGEKQLVNLASVMVTDPDILLLDEPTGQLDPIAADRFTDIVKKLNREMNLTVIIVEHRAEELWNCADNIILMENGRAEKLTKRDIANGKISNKSIEKPYAVRLFEKLNINSECPLTVGECRNFLSKNFKNIYDSINEEPYEKNVAIELKNIYFRYEKNSADVLKKLNFSADYGKILTLLGGNGSGKTTLLSLISGRLKPYSGKVKTYGGKIAVLPQNVKTVFTKDVLREDFELITSDFEDVCNLLQITHLIDRNPFDLSGGEAQRAALAKVLLLKPDILCLDEPTKGIDAEGKRIIGKILKSLASDGVCVITVSHDADFSAEISDMCAFLFDGQIVSEGSPREVFSKNRFYTTYASRISRHMYKNAVTIDDIVTLCKRNYL